VHSPPTAEIYHYFLLLPIRIPWCSQEIPDQPVNDMQPEEVAPVDQRRPTLELLHEKAKKVRLIGIVQPLHAAFRDDAAVVCLVHKISVLCHFRGWHGLSRGKV
jgi:hypothetical protein